MPYTKSCGKPLALVQLAREQEPVARRGGDAGGPPAAVYLLSRKLDKTSYQGTTVLVFWVINIVKFVPYAFLGLFTAETALANLALAPVAIAGALIGIKAHQIVSERLFFGLTYVLLVVTGAKLIWEGLT